MHDWIDLQGSGMGIVGKEQISQDGMVRLFCPTSFRFLHTFCKWLCNSWDHLQPCTCTSWGTHWMEGCVMLCYVMLHYVTLHFVMSCLLLWLVWQEEENKRVCSCYSSLHLLPASLIVPCLLGSTNRADSETQQDNWHHEQSQWHRYIFSLTINLLFHFSARY